jgi:hypothetical protein
MAQRMKERDQEDEKREREMAQRELEWSKRCDLEKTRVTEKEEEIRAAMADAGPYMCY